MSQNEQIPANDVEMDEWEDEPEVPESEPNQFVKDSKLLRKLTDAILFQPNPNNDRCFVEDQEFLIQPKAKEVEKANIEDDENEKKFKTLDRFLIYLMNNTVLADNEKSQMRPEKYDMEEPAKRIEEEELDIDFDKLDLKELLKGFDLGFKSDREDRISDEASFMISILQQQLDRSKVDNLSNLQGLADLIDRTQQLERFKTFQIVQKVR